MNFYDTVTEDNAILWYSELPDHLKKTIDDKRLKFKSGRECTRNEIPALYETVTKELGTRPLKPADPTDPLDGWTVAQMEQYEKHKKWGARYDELLLISLVVDNAPVIQRDRKLLAQSMGLDIGSLPNQAEGLDPVQAATIAWVQNSGETPLEILAKMARDPDAKPSDRISAAAKLMDYVHRRVPLKQEIETKAKMPEIDPSLMRGLNKDELIKFKELVKKMRENEE